MVGLVARPGPAPATPNIPPSPPISTSVPIPTVANLSNFTAFDATSQLSKDYWTRFFTFAGVHSTLYDKRTQAFLTNKIITINIIICTMAKSLSIPKNINELILSEITEFMKQQFNPKHFVVRERFKFLYNKEQKPSETVQELAA